MREATKKLVQELLEAQAECFEKAAQLTDEQLDTTVPLGSRETRVRNILYLRVLSHEPVP